LEKIKFGRDENPRLKKGEDEIETGKESSVGGTATEIKAQSAASACVGRNSVGGGQKNPNNGK